MRLSDHELKQFTALVRKLTGIQMNEQKRSLLENRLGRRISALGLKSYLDYLKLLETQGEGSPEYTKFVDAVTTNETFFFRAPKVWEWFSRSYLPQWYGKNKNQTLNMWCAASSSGEEPYTIAMLCEEFALRNPDFRWTLKASDISEEMLANCKKATYSGRSIELIEPPLLRRYFSQKGDDFTVVPELRSKIRFFKHNLQEKPPTQVMDLIWLRNVMIYFDLPTKEKILNEMFQVVRPDGFLVVGESEGMIGVKNDFKFVQASIYHRPIVGKAEGVN